MHPAAVLILLAPLATACADDQRPDQGWGGVTFSWTIDQNEAPNLCTELSADRFSAVLLNRGVINATYQAPCADFQLETGMLVASDEYTARISLTDDQSLPKTEDVLSPSFSILPGEATRLQVNFGTDTTIEVEAPASDAGAQ
jgi:hypothetical protein